MVIIAAKTVMSEIRIPDREFDANCFPFIMPQNYNKNQAKISYY